MRELGKLLWHFPFFGFLTATLAVLGGTLLTLLVFTVPVGLGLIDVGRFPTRRSRANS